MGIVPLDLMKKKKQLIFGSYTDAKKFAREIFHAYLNKGKGIVSDFQSQQYAILHVLLLIEWEQYCFGDAVESNSVKYLKKVIAELKNILST